jgi:hypothetical protein
MRPTKVITTQLAMPAELQVVADLAAAEGQANFLHKSEEWPFSSPLATLQV